MLGKTINKIINPLGYRVVKKTYDIPRNLSKEFLEIYSKRKWTEFSMTRTENLYASHQAVNYVLENRIEGDIVECGVWRGGNSMVMMETMLLNCTADRVFWMYDTYTGMSEPTEHDKKHNGIDVVGKWKALQKEGNNEWCYASLEDVQKNVALIKYPNKNIKFVKGKVEDTIPGEVPNKISILRLDTDWYEPTRHSLEHLFSRVSEGGVVIIDDYGSWAGARKAVDDFFIQKGLHPFLHRIDQTARLFIK